MSPIKAPGIYGQYRLDASFTYPQGGGADAMARLIAPKLGEALGQNVIVENKPGAGGQIGASAVAKAVPDGHTLMLDASSFAVKDSVSFASSGNGSAQHLAGALFESVAKVAMVHVPYKGGGPALNDVIGGQVPLFFGNLASTLPHIQGGRLRALAVTSAKRSPILPDVPTLAEAGVSGAEVYEWNAVFAPAATPEAVVVKLAAALKKALDAPDIKARIAQLGGEIQKGDPDTARRFVREQTALWARVVKASAISVE